MSSAGNSLRSQFPILQKKIGGHPLVYLDSASTSQKPKSVLEAMQRFYEEDNANIKRGMHPLAEQSTEVYEAARSRVQKFLHAPCPHEILFTRNTTEGINLVARSWGETFLKKDDVILVSLLEHHSNIVPWLQLKEKIGIEVEWISIDSDGTLNLDDLKEKLAKGNVKLVALTCVSNVLGVVTPFREVVKLAHKHNALCLLDAAQLAPHSPINVTKIDCDFLVFSGHKLYGPTGIGVLFGKEEHLKKMPPFLGGGTMIQEVHRTMFTSADLPEKFEAGTPPIAEAVGLHAALDFLTELGWENIAKYEQSLLAYALKTLSKLPFIEVLGPKEAKKIASCISFVTQIPDDPLKVDPTELRGVHPHDLTEYMGRKGICLRAGHHCTQPLHRFLKVPATTRLSIGIYNTEEDIDRMCEILEEGYHFFTGK